MNTPAITAKALRFLVRQIQAPDDIPAMCLSDAADLIEKQGKDCERMASILREIKAGCLLWHHHDPKDTTRGWSSELEIYLRGRSATVIAVDRDIANAIEAVESPNLQDHPAGQPPNPQTE